MIITITWFVNLLGRFEEYGTTINMFSVGFWHRACPGLGRKHAVVAIFLQFWLKVSHELFRLNFLNTESKTRKEYLWRKQKLYQNYRNPCITALHFTGNRYSKLNKSAAILVKVLIHHLVTGPCEYLDRLSYALPTDYRLNQKCLSYAQNFAMQYFRSLK